MTDRIEKLTQQIRQLEHQKKAKENVLAKNQDRKNRTRLLIQTGALCEKYLPIKKMSVAERETFFKELKSRYEKEG